VFASGRFPSVGARNRQGAALRNQESEMSDKDDDQRRDKLVKAGVAVGIGSAAIVAALLYASKIKKPRRGQ
jgi:hypothetical protein